jgi:hypothetical protein
MHSGLSLDKEIYWKTVEIISRGQQQQNNDPQYKIVG